MKTLFVAGCPRSGTTAFIKYLNLHPEILVTRERYSWKQDITPDMFTVERLLDFRPEETAQPRSDTEELLASKDFDSLKWIGDKRPRYFTRYKELAASNPDAHFVYLYRPVGPVAESFQARFEAADGWPLNFERGVEIWNSGLIETRRFIKSGGACLVVDYDGFFADPSSWKEVLEAFLGLRFSPETLRQWRELGSQHSKDRRVKSTLTTEQEKYIQEHKHDKAERWIIKTIERQFSENR